MRAATARSGLLRWRCLKAAGSTCKVAFRGLEDHMQMIAHQGEQVKSDAVLINSIGQSIQ
jgi:hypothetical protein